MILEHRFSRALAEYIEAHGGGTLVAEWDLLIPTTAPYFSIETAIEILDQFKNSFEFAHFDTIHTASVDTSGVVSRHEFSGNSVLPSLHSLCGDHQCGGVEAHLDLDLAWCGSDGLLHVAPISEAGKLVVTRLEDEPTLMASLSLFVNLYSDGIVLLTGASSTCVEGAHQNRARLNSSLRRWCETSGGLVDSWDSDFLEEGSIDGMGIRPTARVSGSHTTT